MSRWKFPTHKVTSGENSQEVRGLSHAQRQQMAQMVRASRDPASAVDNHTVQAFVVRAGAVNPELSEQDVAEMPHDLADECSAKILELTGLHEKKAEPTPS